MASKTLEQTAVLPASSSEIWAVLADFGEYGNWNSYLRNVKGQTRVGATLMVYMKLPNGRTFYSKSKLSVLDADREMRWKNRLYFPGLYDVEHFFVLEDLGNNRCRVHAGQTFSGMLMKPILKNVEKEVEEALTGMLKNLKHRLREQSKS